MLVAAYMVMFLLQKLTTIHTALFCSHRLTRAHYVLMSSLQRLTTIHNIPVPVISGSVSGIHLVKRQLTLDNRYE